MNAPQPTPRAADLTDEQAARIAQAAHSDVEAILKAHGVLPRDGHLRIVDGRLEVPLEGRVGGCGWMVDWAIKFAADRVAAQDAREDQAAARDPGGAR
jgi:hypothetical protein